MKKCEGNIEHLTFDMSCVRAHLLDCLLINVLILTLKLPETNDFHSVECKAFSSGSLGVKKLTLGATNKKY